jgi:two-component system cell cycle sensor histidine kinase/response regulator CckA
MTTLKPFSCYSSSVLINYAKKLGMPNEKIFANIESFQGILENPLEWIEAETWIACIKNIDSFFSHIPQFLFNAGKEITISQTSNFQLFFFKIAPLKIILSNIQRHIEKHINRAISWNPIIKKNGEIEIIISPHKNIPYSTQICDFDKGCALATAILKNYKNPHIEEVQCAARSSAESCVYRITWDPENNLLWKLRNFIFLRFRGQRSILEHMELTHTKLHSQYQEILSMRDFYSHIMENMGEAVAWLNKDGAVNFSNNSFLSLIGIKKEESVGKQFSTFLITDNGLEEFNKVKNDALTNPLITQNTELIFKCHNGGKKFGQTNIIWVPSEHRDPGYLISIRDVTDKKIIEQQLFVEKDKHRALYENSPAIIIGLDMNGKFIYANPAMVEQCGYSEEELKSMTFKQLIAPEADGAMDGIVDKLLSQPTRLQEVHFKTKGGEWKSITLSTYRILNADHTLAGVAGVGVDVTETKRLNEQLIRSQRMQLLGQMAGEVAHDFKNMLASISGYSTLILQKAKEEKVLSYAHTIEQVCVRASDLLKDLLAFSRSGFATMKKVDINEIAGEVVKLMNGIVPKSVTIATDISQAPLCIMGDPGKIHQCVLNLCMNANDAIGDRQGSITIRTKKAEGKANCIWIQVDDTGSGIPPDIIDKIFDPFFTTKKKTGGTGLGLSVVYGIITAHKGDVHVSTRPGEGTTFTLEIPEFVEEGKGPLDTRKTVMVLDGDDLQRSYCMDILKNYGHKAVDFSKVKDAEDWLRDHANETWFALSDVIMPDMNTNDFLSTCQKIKTNFICVWMSGKVTPEMNQYSNLGLFLKKPFTPAALIETIKTLKVN